MTTFSFLDEAIQSAWHALIFLVDKCNNTIMHQILPPLNIDNIISDIYYRLLYVQKWHQPHVHGPEMYVPLL